MPKVNVVESSDDDDDDEEEYQPITQSQKGTQLTPQETTKLAGLVCNFLLVSECKKVPAKRVDIKKLVLKDRNRHFATVMKEASETMERVFGYKIKELQSGSYILVNYLGVSTSEGGSYSTSQSARVGLLTAVLAAIFMTGDKMQEGGLEAYLKILGLDLQSKELHPQLGNINKLIHQDFVREKYLEVTPNLNTDPPSREYQWGQRAHLELSKKDTLELVCKVYGDNMKPELWTSQWKAVQKEAEIEEVAEK